MIWVLGLVVMLALSMREAALRRERLLAEGRAEEAGKTSAQDIWTDTGWLVVGLLAFTALNFVVGAIPRWAVVAAIALSYFAWVQAYVWGHFDGSITERVRLYPPRSSRPVALPALLLRYLVMVVLASWEHVGTDLRGLSGASVRSLQWLALTLAVAVLLSLRGHESRFIATNYQQIAWFKIHAREVADEISGKGENKVPNTAGSHNGGDDEPPSGA